MIVYNSKGSKSIFFIAAMVIWCWKNLISCLINQSRICEQQCDLKKYRLVNILKFSCILTCSAKSLWFRFSVNSNTYRIGQNFKQQLTISNMPLMHVNHNETRLPSQSGKFQSYAESVYLWKPKNRWEWVKIGRCKINWNSRFNKLKNSALRSKPFEF